MNDEKWIEDVFQSLKDGQRAKPSASLFSKIQSQIEDLEVRIVSIRHIRFTVAAAIMIYGLNIFLIHQFIKNNEQQEFEMTATIENYSQHIISNYKIYE